MAEVNPDFLADLVSERMKRLPAIYQAWGQTPEYRIELSFTKRQRSKQNKFLAWGTVEDDGSRTKHA